MNLVKRFIREDDGQSMIEYALLAGLIAVAAIAILTLLRGNIVTTFTTVNDALAGATVGDAG